MFSLVTIVHKYVLDSNKYIFILCIQESKDKMMNNFIIKKLCEIIM